MLTPYSTTFGKAYINKKIQDEYYLYINSTNAKYLNYEFKNGDKTKLAFITGYSREERELPSLDHTLLIDDTLITDLRAYMYPVEDDEQPINLLLQQMKLEDIKYLTYRAAMTLDWIEGNYGLYRSVTPYIVTGYITLVSHVVDTIVKLSPAERSSVELAAANFIYRSCVDPKEVKDPDTIQLVEANVKRVKYSWNLDDKFIDSVHDLIRSVEYTGTINNLVEYIQAVIQNGKEKLINQNVFVNICSNMWYGVGQASALLIGLEHMPTWTMLMYASFNNKNYRRSRLSTILDKNSRKIQPTDFIKKIDTLMKEDHIHN